MILPVGINQYLSMHYSQIQESLLQDGVNSDIVAKALSSYESYDNLKLFSGLETAYLQRKYNIIIINRNLECW